jgi:tetratricopeptide (TPR) repeat protein
LARLGEVTKAIDAISRVIEVEPMAGDFIMRAALRGDSEAEAKRADFEAALEIEPRSREARLGLAAVHIEATQLEEAVPLLDELIDFDASDVSALGERGIAHLLNGDTELANLEFEAARTNADSATALNTLCWRKATLDNA